jgi:uncharacterized protein (TIGR02996 family)
VAKSKKPVAFPATVHPEEAAFLRALVAAPKDRTARLVYADWLDERSDPRAAWLRDDWVWERVRREPLRWLTPDPRGPIASLLEALDPSAGHGRPEVVGALLGMLGGSAVEAVRAWVRERDTFDRWDVARGLLEAFRPVKLRTVPVLIKPLARSGWYECWEAVTDLRFHGPAAAPAAKALLKVAGRSWDELEERECHDVVARAVYETLGAIGPAAAAAVPTLAYAAHYSDEAFTALLAIHPDPDLVAEHICCDEDRSAAVGVGLVRALDPTGTGALTRILRTRPGRGAQAAAELLGHMGAEATSAVPAMLEVFQNLKGNWNCHFLRQLLAEALARIDDPAAVPVLRAVLAEYEQPGAPDRDAAATRDAITTALAHLDRPRRARRAPARKGKRNQA